VRGEKLNQSDYEAWFEILRRENLPFVDFQITAFLDRGFEATNKIFESANYCQGCDTYSCCTGDEPPEMNQENLRNLAARKKMTPEEARNKFCVEGGGKVYLKSPCLFLDKNNRCDTYPTRPVLCKFYPIRPRFNRIIMSTRSSTIGLFFEFVFNPKCRLSQTIYQFYDELVGQEKPNANLEYFSPIIPQNIKLEVLENFADWLERRVKLL
jgi:Fe-S-cluster containining protein